MNAALNFFSLSLKFGLLLSIKLQIYSFISKIYRIDINDHECIIDINGTVLSWADWSMIQLIE
jgi:hypothetical protein